MYPRTLRHSKRIVSDLSQTFCIFDKEAFSKAKRKLAQDFILRYI